MNKQYTIGSIAHTKGGPPRAIIAILEGNQYDKCLKMVTTALDLKFKDMWKFHSNGKQILWHDTVAGGYCAGTVEVYEVTEDGWQAYLWQNLQGASQNR